MSKADPQERWSSLTYSLKDILKKAMQEAILDDFKELRTKDSSKKKKKKKTLERDQDKNHE